ncbi:efflux RND transporter permease subunit [Sulfurimonas sp.]|uniref:efflux RND transporter permease subunit n=1 Tax=Sulfurimonas sp. TaxID=2022749 RepID=UPI002B495517|nr:efflux RND transporter permease subunit [Sulfurimonas sp.]
MNITRLAIRNNRLTYFLVFALMAFGISTYFKLPKAQDPGFTIRTVAITTYLPGASPDRVEQLVTDKIEQVIQQMPELDNVTSDSQMGVSIINATFKDEYKEMQPIFDKVRRKVETVQGDLPSEASIPQVDDEYGDVFGMVYTLSGDGFSYIELKDIADEIRNNLLLLKQVAKVDIHGNQKEVIFVEYNNAKLQKLGLSPDSLRNTLKNINILSSGGNVLIGSERIALEPSGNFESLEDIKRAVINIPNSSEMLYLEDIANVYAGYKDPKESAVHANGKPALVIAVSMKDGGNILELGKKLKSVMPILEERYPHGLRVEAVAFQPDLVETSVNGFMSNLAQSVITVFIVIFVFLGFRTGITVALLVPVVMAITFVAMDYFAIGINKMSLAALIIALGLLVDNGIVMAEGILVRLQKGEDKKEAVIATGGEMLIPLLVSSLTTSAAFLPILIAQSALSEFTGDIAKVVTIALILSWVIALTFIPLLAQQIIKIKIKNNDDKGMFSGKGYSIYRKILAISLKFKLLVLALIIMLFVLSINGLGIVAKVFIPPSTDPIINAKFDMPIGTSIETTEQIAYDIEKYLQEEWLVTEENKVGVTTWMTFIGTGAPKFVLGYTPGSPSSRHIAMVLNITDYRLITKLSQALEKHIQVKYPDLQLQLKKLENGPPVGYPVSIRIQGKDQDVLYKIVSDLKEQLYSIPDVASVIDDWGPPTKKLLVKVNQERAFRAGVTSQDVALSLESSLSGIDLTQYRKGETLIPVTLRSVQSDRQDISKLDGITIYASASGSQVPLKQVADVEMVWQAGLIKRRGRLKTITVDVQLIPGASVTTVNNILVPWLVNDAKKWPQGYKYEQGGEAEASNDAAASIIGGLPMAGMIIVLLLIGQFNSIRKMVIVLLTIPLGMIGVTSGLIIAKTTFGFFTILGIVALAGIIINNAIVLLDRIKIEIEENELTPQNAIFEAAQQRLRPILLTTATTVGGMLPLWISHDPMFETMAVAIIFGLLFATVLTLVFVPIMYSLLFRVSFKDWRYK